MKDTRETRGLRETLETIRVKGLQGTTPADLKALIVQVIRLAGVISGVMALIGVITDLATILAAVKEALRDRTIDLRELKSRVRVSFRKPRLRKKSAEMKKSAEAIRREIRDQGKTLFTKRMRQL